MRDNTGSPEAFTVEAAHAALVELLGKGLNELPLPAGGRTLERWRFLAEIAAEDVSVVKLVEGHTDALAIMAELETPAFVIPAGSSWGTWAAEPPDAQVQAVPSGSQLLLTGRKAWCSGVSVVSHGLLTCRGPEGQRWLAAVDLRQPGIVTDTTGWAAVGMAGTASGTVTFDGVPAVLIGGDDDYLRRRGFWLGGAGIAACWWGAAVGVARPLLTQVARQGAGDPHAAAHLGRVQVALAETAALLRQTAAAADHGWDSGETVSAQLCRASAERTATLVLDSVGRATGAGPLCSDAGHARRVADLTVFLRQSHAERDLAGIGAELLSEIVL